MLDGFISEYRNFLKKDFAGQLKKYSIDYVVWDKEKNPSWPAEKMFHDKIYEINNLAVYSVN